MSNTQSQIEYAINKNDIIGVRQLIAKKGRGLLTPSLVYALESNKPDICKLLVKLGANCGAHISRQGLSPGNSTPLIDVLRARHFDVANAMFKRGYRIDFIHDADKVVIYEMIHACNKKWKEKITSRPSSFGALPKNTLLDYLRYATIHDDVDLMDILFKFDLSPLHVFKNGNTLLHIACTNASIKAAENLIKRLHNLSIENKSGETVFHILCSKFDDKETIPFTYFGRELEWSTKFASVEKFLYKCENNLPIKEDSDPISSYLSKDDALQNKYSILNLLCSLPHDINQKNIDGNTPLHIALINNLPLKFINILLNDGASVNALNNEGKSPIYYACSSKKIRLLMKYGANLNIVDKKNVSLLEYAICCKNKSLICELFRINDNPSLCLTHVNEVLKTVFINQFFVSKLLNYLVRLGADIGLFFKDMPEPLHYSCRAGSLWLVKYMLNKGENIGLVDGAGSTPLHALIGAPEFKKYNEIIEILKMHGLDINTQNHAGETALHYIIKSNHSIQYKIDVCSALIKHGALIGVTDSYKQNILHTICNESAGMRKMIPHLVQYIDKIQLEQKDVQGKTPFHYLFEWKDFYLLDKIMVEALLKKDPNINIHDNDGKTILHYLCSHFRVSDDAIEYISLLVANNINVNQVDSEGRTALHIAALNNFCNVIGALKNIDANPFLKDKYNLMPIDYLFEYGLKFFSSDCTNLDCESIDFLIPSSININNSNPLNGETYLIKAMRSGISIHVEKLINQGADIFQVNIFGIDPIAWSCLTGDFNVFKILIEQGATIKKLYPNNETLLHFSAMGNNPDIIRYLAPYFSSIDVTNDDGLTPFYFALASGAKETSEALLSLGANINPKINLKKRKTISGAEVADFRGIHAHYYSTSLNVTDGIKVNMLSYGTRLLTNLAANGARKSLILLKEILVNKNSLAYRHSINDCDEYGWTALHHAAFFGSEITMSALIDLGADPTIKSNAGETPMDIYIYSNRYL